MLEQFKHKLLKLLEIIRAAIAWIGMGYVPEASDFNCKCWMITFTMGVVVLRCFSKAAIRLFAVVATF